MSWRRGINFWHIILLALNCLLLAAIFHVWWGEEGKPVQFRAGKGPEVPQTPLLRDQQPLTAFRVVSLKNLFSQDRTGPDIGGGTTAKVQNTLEGRQLLGTIIIGEERAALISASKAKGRAARRAGVVPGAAPGGATDVEVVRVGEDWDGLKVLEITTEAVTFQSKDGKKTLNFPE